MLEKLKTDFKLYRLRRNEINYQKDIDEYREAIKYQQNLIQDRYDRIMDIRMERVRLMKS